jgi:hypothetical protein
VHQQEQTMPIDARAQSRAFRARLSAAIERTGGSLAGSTLPIDPARAEWIEAARAGSQAFRARLRSVIARTGGDLGHGRVSHRTTA